MRPAARRSSAGLRVAFAALLLLVDATHATKKQKRQLFRENVLPFFGGKIPDSAFRADRLALNVLNKEGISVPDGVVFEARPKESFHQSPRDDPEISNSIIKMIHSPDGRFVPPEGRYEAENEVETTYKILIPSNLQNYHLPRYRPIPEMLQLPVRDVFENNLSLSPSKQQMGVSFYPLQQGWTLHDTHRPYVNPFNQNSNKLINIQQNFNTIHLTSFVCDESRFGKMYPDPETQCQVFHLCHFNGFKETFVCPQGTRYDLSSQECRLWFMTPCLNIRRPY